MSTAVSEKIAPIRPQKPRKDFPLFPHASRQWAKKVRGRLRYFGIWADPEAAEHRWLAQRDDLLAGRPVRPVGADELLLKDLCNHFLTRKQKARDDGEITARTFSEYLAACQRMARVVGSTTPVSHLVPGDFGRLRSEMRQTLGPVRLCVEIQRIRTLFRYGIAHDLISKLPTYGDGFSKPSRKMLRKHRAERGLRMFEAEQIRDILEHAGPTLRAMVLLACNCGFGNTDLGKIEKRRLDLKTGWVDYPRPKTEVARRCPLWPETVAAIRTVLRGRKGKGGAEIKGARGLGLGATKSSAPSPQSPVPSPAPSPQSPVPSLAPSPQSPVPSPAPSSQSPVPSSRFRRRVFLTKYGRPWQAKSGNPITEAFGRLVRRLGIHRPGLGFYALRHTFQTIAGNTKDPEAVSAIMGHAEKADDMAAVYRERIDDARLTAVTEYVRGWLFGNEKK